MPGMKAMSISAAKKITEFVKTGGTLICVSELPLMETEYAKNDELRKIIRDLFGVNEVGKSMKINKCGQGKCISLPYFELSETEPILNSAGNDTTILRKTFGLQYIHKRTNNKDIWFFASINRKANTDVILYGSFNLKSINPFTGEETDLISEHKNNSTKFHLLLEKEQSIIIGGTKCII